MKTKKIASISALAALAIVLGYCSKQKENLDTQPEGANKNSTKSTEAIGNTITPIQIYGVWHAGNDACVWGTVRDTAGEFKQRNQWIINRGDGRPSVNLVVLSFVHPIKLLNKTNDLQTVNGIPRGMNKAVVEFFKKRGIRVMLSIGGITYTQAWTQALSTNARQLGLNAAEVAKDLGVGFEIDYEESKSPNLTGLQAFIDAYRIESNLPYDSTGTNLAARLTIDLAAGDRWLIGICQKATADWLRTNKGERVLDYANAMVPARQPSSSSAQANWQEHIDGKPQYSPAIPPLAPCKFTGSLWLVGRSPIPECINFDNSLQKSTGTFVRGVLPHPALADRSPGMLGYMFWAAECEGTRTVCTTTDDNSACTRGVGAGANFYNIPIPMQALRQK